MIQGQDEAGGSDDGDRCAVMKIDEAFNATCSCTMDFGFMPMVKYT
jgi:hypothetical protein